MFKGHRVAFSILGGVSFAMACGGTMDVGGGAGEAGADPTSGGTGGAAAGADGGSQQPKAGAAGAGTAGAGRGGQAGASSGSGGNGGTGAGTGGANSGSGGGAGTLAGTGGTAGTTPLGGNGGDSSASGGEGAEAASGGEGANPGDCECATSEELTLIDCGGGRSFYNFPSTYVSDDGTTVIFAPIDENSQIGLDLGIWTAASGTTIVSGYPLGLSGDGQVMLIGRGTTSHYSDASGETVVPAVVRKLSRDGLVAAGVDDGSASRQAVTWTRAGGIVDTEVGVSDAVVQAISSNGAVIGGQTIDLTNSAFHSREPFIWSESTGAVVLGEPPEDGSAPNGLVSALSGNGAYAAGMIRASESDIRLFHYSAASGMTDLGRCFAQDFDCTVNPFDAGLAFSDDGSVLAGGLGQMDDPYSGHAFVYTEEDGVTLLTGTELSTVRGISGDGSVVLGILLDGSYGKGTPFVWDQTRGVRRLPDVLSAAEVDLSGWTLDGASQLSKDGEVIIGSGLCGGQPALYRAVLPD